MCAWRSTGFQLWGEQAFLPVHDDTQRARMPASHTATNGCVPIVSFHQNLNGARSLKHASGLQGRKHVRHIRKPKSPSLSRGPFAFQIAHAKNLSSFPDPCCPVVGSHPARIGPGVDGEEFAGDSGRDMHRSTVDADREGGGPNQPDQLQQRRLIRQVYAGIRARDFAGALTNNHDAIRRQGATKFFDYGSGK